MYSSLYFSQIDTDVLAPAIVERAAVRADVDDGRVTQVVDQHLPASFAFAFLGPPQKWRAFHLRIFQLDVEVVETARRFHPSFI